MDDDSDSDEEQKKGEKKKKDEVEEEAKPADLLGDLLGMGPSEPEVKQPSSGLTGGLDMLDFGGG
jgi:hypothetical protein